MNNFLRKRFQPFTEVNKTKQAGIYSFFRPFESIQDTVVQVNGKKLLMFGSNSYLGLSSHPKVIEATLKAQKKYGSSCTGSRFLNGNTDLHDELEMCLAQFLKKEKVLIFSTGFQANLGALSTLTRKGDIILMDRLNHASLFEGAKLSDASVVVFRHNDMLSLENKLQKIDRECMKFIVVDGVFSMEGDIANLPKIVDLAEKYHAVVMSDCAHAVGVIGDHGRGTANHFGLTDKVELISGTFSKSLASVGGFIAGDKITIDYLKHHARSLIFSASMTPASTAAVLTSMKIIQTDDSLRQNLWKNTHYAMKRLNYEGFDVGKTETPIIPIYIRNNEKTFALTMKLFDNGVFVNPVVAPGVSPSDALLRFSIMSSHSFNQIDQAIDLIKKCAKELQIQCFNQMITV